MFVSQAYPSVADVIEALCEADAANARAVALIAAVGCAAIASERAMPTEMALSLGAGRQRFEVRALIGMAECLQAMPHLSRALSDGKVSFSQARGIWLSARELDRAGKAELDARLGGRVRALADAEPEALVDAAADIAAGLRPEAQLRREERRIERSFLALQRALDGGATLYGELDPEAGATVIEALDAAAAAPVDAADDEAPSRAQQYAQALVGICEATLAGGASATGPRPRFLVTCDVADLQALGASEGARLLWGLAGGPARLSPLATGVLSCDAEIAAVIFDGARPVAVSNPRARVPDKVRTAIIARDAGCRFPGCSAPAGWSDVHHIDAGGGHDPSNLVLLCRRCHRRLHRRPWRITHRPDGSIAFTHQGRTYASPPRARPLRT